MNLKENIKVAVVQTDLHWENVDANLAMLSKTIGEAKAADIYVLPEMFTTGFSMQPEKFAKESYQKGLSWLKETAKAKQAAIMGSIMVEESGKYYNRLYFITPTNNIYQYDKKHLFSLGNEQEHYAAGDNPLTIDYLGWRIKPLVCYDLRFPVWSRNTNNYELLIYVANWPEKRIHHWRSLLIARAIENQCYVAACNRVGADANAISHNGNSILVEYSGTVLLECVDKSDILYQNFSKKALEKYKSAFPFLADRDKFSL